MKDSNLITFIAFSVGTTTISYDFEGRATSISGPGISQSNTYNGLDGIMNMVQESRSGRKSRSKVLAWAFTIILFGCAIWAWIYRSQFSFPPMYGTFLEAAVHQIVGPNRTNYGGSDLVLLWGLTGLLGILASLSVIAVSDWKSERGWRLLHLLSVGTIPTVFLTTGIWIFPPFMLVTAIGVVSLPVCTLASIACLVMIVKQRVPPSHEGFLTVCQLLAWSALGLFAADWVNLSMVGGS